MRINKIEILRDIDINHNINVVLKKGSHKFDQLNQIENI